MPPKDSVLSNEEWRQAIAPSYVHPARAAEVELPTFQEDVADYYQQPAKAAEVNVPEMEPAVDVAWPEPDPVYYEMVFHISLEVAEVMMKRLMKAHRAGFIEELLPKDLAYGSLAVAIGEIMKELQDARHAAQTLKRYAEEAGKAKEG